MAWLRKLPVFGALRYPDRFFVLVQLGLAGLAGDGTRRLVQRLAPQGGRPALAVAGLLLGITLAEFWPGPMPSVPAPDPIPLPRSSSQDPGAVLHLPTRFRNPDGEMMFHQTRHGRAVVGGYLTRRDGETVGRLLGNPFLGPLIDHGSRPLPEGLAVGLAELGISYVFVQTRPAVEAPPPTGGRILGPFCVSGRSYLRERLFPHYLDQDGMGSAARAWQADLDRLLGPPAAHSALGTSYRVAIP